ncbi:MAG TPA: tetratricopeptide repeat protein, partial [Chitinivibrionales bacterium]|nr:tetratricopeptide repeat protein [Chitinivibrionales bacterium]
MRTSKLKLVLCITMVCAMGVAWKGAFGADDTEAKKKAILEQIKKLEEQKAHFAGKPAANQNLDEIVARYENLLSGCTKKSDRCADVLFTLAQLYYQQAQDGYIKAREEYGREMDEYDKNPKGRKEPVNPIPNYSKAMKMYNRLVHEYSDFRTIDEAYYQMGNIYLVMGELDSSGWAMEQLIRVAPNGQRTSSAHFRLGDFAYMQHDYPKALKHLELCKPEGLSPDNQGMVQYRKGDIYYNMGEFDKAVQCFQEYIQKCDAGEYPKQEFRGEALEMMSVAFSDMPKGSEEAEKFFRKVGGRPYEDYVIYTIGMKNRVHGQTDDAIVALQYALKRFPFYKDAPIAQQMLVECFIIKKDYEKANTAREKLVDFYGPNGEWSAKNASQKVVMDQARDQVRKALAAIPLYYHGLAQKSKDKALYEKAL